MDSTICNLNFEQVKEIGVMIGVSWRLADEEKNKEGDRYRNKNRDSGKKGMIRNMTRDEHPNIIRIQETKCGVVDDEWIEDAMGDERYIALKGSWKGKDEDVFLVSIYGLHVSIQKSSLWERHSGLMYRWKGAWCIFGDLNMVTRIDDRLKSQVNMKEMTKFNDFVNDTRLVEVPMCGGRGGNSRE
ncbi:RNA-directed DNA polymerase, eukaryota [Tanacetum coccineum]